MDSRLTFLAEVLLAPLAVAIALLLLVLVVHFVLSRRRRSLARHPATP